jgi:ribosomal protein S18 acetylase RimI-like enzyme
MAEHPPLSLVTADPATSIATITSAFARDPVERWLYPDEDQYQQHFPPFAAALGAKAFEEGTAWTLTEGHAVALWLPPGTDPDVESIVDLLAASLAPDKHEATFEVLGQMAAAHPPQPHWYLPWLAVEAGGQAQGLGGRLLSTCLAAVDATHQPAYLETPNLRTLAFYRRHGFEVTGHAQAGSCPPLTLMVRTAR